MSDEPKREEQTRDEEQSPDEQPVGGVYVPQIRPAMEDVCCGSGCSGCPTYWGE